IGWTSMATVSSRKKNSGRYARIVGADLINEFGFERAPLFLLRAVIVAEAARIRTPLWQRNHRPVIDYQTQQCRRENVDRAPAATFAYLGSVCSERDAPVFLPFAGEPRKFRSLSNCIYGRAKNLHKGPKEQRIKGV